MIQLVRTNSANKDFVNLVKDLDASLAITDGDDHAFYDQFNKIDAIKYIIVAYENGVALGCGAIKQFDSKTMEIKRMFTTQKSRGKGIASIVLNALEKWTLELAFERCILETGIRQVAAIGLYKKNNYQVIENYGQYTGVSESVCFGKSVKK